MALKIDNTLIAIGVAVVAAYLYSQSKKNDESQSANVVDVNTTTTTAVNTQTTAAKAVVISYPIVYGKYHPDVKKLQIALKVTPDGVIGPATLTAWKKYNPGVTTRLKISNFTMLAAQIFLIVKAKILPNLF